ncbi:O-antigen acetylase [plant metagenome]|uniref:O-antigen acetylase n=1 Tax=plant metagenome TaxID=1297885 RepID=A0A484T5W3_9ZZZZ
MHLRPTPSVTTFSHRDDIDGLRAVAVLAVLLFHAFPGVLPGGYAGVDVFFVISGFLITRLINESLLAGRFSLLDFYKKRIRRLFPALLLVLAACCLYGWFALLPSEYAQLGKHTAGGAGFVANLVLWSEAGYFDNAAETKPLLHLWSLGIEEQFYIIWPLVLMLGFRLFGGRKRRWLVAALMTLLIASFLLNIHQTRTDVVAAFYSPLTRAWELLVGALLALMHTTRGPTNRSFNRNASIAGMLLILASYLLLDKQAAFPGWWALLPVTGTALIIASGPSSPEHRRILTHPIAVRIGLISFPLYLWHWPILTFLRFQHDGEPAIPTMILALLASGVLAELTTRYVEQPIRFGQRRPRDIIGLCLAGLAVGTTGIIIFLLHGLPQRMPEDIRSIADYKYEYATDARAGKCWLSGKQAPEDFAPTCFAGQTNGILLWGDSHAARLYPALRAATARGITQLTRDSCPPVLDLGYPTCQQSNTHVLNQVKRLRPRTVILHATWTHYGQGWESDSSEMENLRATIESVKQAGVPELIIIGPSPEWTEPLPKLVYKHWAADTLPRRIPERLSAGLTAGPANVNKALELGLAGTGIRYVSALAQLCNSEGCLTHAPGAPKDLLSWDEGHLTNAGATLLLQPLIPLLRDQEQRAAEWETQAGTN